jgi:hypothetical protein
LKVTRNGYQKERRKEEKRERKQREKREIAGAREEIGKLRCLEALTIIMLPAQGVQLQTEPNNRR